MNNHTTSQMKDAIRILKVLKDSCEYSKAVRRAMEIAIYAIEKLMKEGD